jgi:hypothetical protein
MRFHHLCGFLSLCLALSGCAYTSTDLSQQLNVNWSADGGKRVVMIDPDVELSELTMSGMTEARADWTATGKNFIRDDIQGVMAARGIDTVTANDLTDPHEVQLVKLHGAVGGSIIMNTLLHLPTKNKNFDWTLGPGVTALRDHYKGDYALFVYVRDSYTTAGRAVLMVAAAAFHVGLQGGQQTGFASLVDLRTGQVVWFNRLNNASGSLKDAKGANTTVSNLLKGLPL